MPRGPLPKPADQKARRNKPTIPTTDLPAGGRLDPAPPIPYWIDLGEAGMAWWEWAWHTPQAAAWDDGQIVVIARRASIEDDLRIINNVDGLDFLDVLNEEEFTAVKRTIEHLSRLCLGRDKLIKRADELDKELGLTPKGMAALRWRVVEDKKPKLSAVASVSAPDFKRSE